MAVVMVIEISDFLSRVEASQYTIFTQKFHSSVIKTLKKYNGNIEQKDNNSYIVVFESVNDAVHCIQDIQHKFKYVTPKHNSFNRRLKIAMCRLTQSKMESITLATRMCENINDEVVITYNVKNEYEHINAHAEIDKDLIRVLSEKEVQWLTDIMSSIESKWDQSNFSVNKLCDSLNLSYSKLYHRLVKLTGKSPNNFIKEFKLHKALLLLYYHTGNISEVAYKTRFSSPSYFSDCFLKKYGIRPSKYIQQHT